MKQMVLKGNEKGSLSIEFIGILPFVIVIFAVFWQLIGTGSSLLIAQKAINESAKVYSITKEPIEAKEIVDEIIGSNTLLDYSNFNVEEDREGYFKVKFTGHHKIIFLPEKWRRTFSIPQQSFSRVIE